LGFGWLWECRPRREDIVGADNQEGEAVELLLLAGFEAGYHVGGDQLQIVAWLGCLLSVSEWYGRCPRWLGSLVSEGRDG